jgi:hypothetical protein
VLDRPLKLAAHPGNARLACRVTTVCLITPHLHKLPLAQTLLCEEP